MDNRQILSKRERFEASLRRCGWSEEAITFEWFKVVYDNMEYDNYFPASGQCLGFFSACNYLHLKGLGN